MMRQNRDPQLAEDGFHYLNARAGEFIEELIGEFHIETDQGIRCWLLELIGEAKDPRALELLADNAKSDDERLQYWGLSGLRKLDTKDARRALHKLGHTA